MAANGSHLDRNDRNEALVFDRRAAAVRGVPSILTSLPRPPPKKGRFLRTNPKISISSGTPGLLRTSRPPIAASSDERTTRWTRPGLDTIFKRFDANGDDQISATELGEALKSMGSVTAGEVKRMTAEIDTDGDGFIFFFDERSITAYRDTYGPAYRDIHTSEKSK